MGEDTLQQILLAPSVQQTLADLMRQGYRHCLQAKPTTWLASLSLEKFDWTIKVQAMLQHWVAENGPQLLAMLRLPEVVEQQVNALDIRKWRKFCCRSCASSCGHHQSGVCARCSHWGFVAGQQPMAGESGLGHLAARGSVRDVRQCNSPQVAYSLPAGCCTHIFTAVAYLGAERTMTVRVACSQCTKAPSSSLA